MRAATGVLILMALSGAVGVRRIHVTDFSPSMKAAAIRRALGRAPVKFGGERVWVSACFSPHHEDPVWCGLEALRIRDSAVVSCARTLRVWSRMISRQLKTPGKPLPGMPNPFFDRRCMGWETRGRTVLACCSSPTTSKFRKRFGPPTATAYIYFRRDDLPGCHIESVPLGTIAEPDCGWTPISP